MPLFGYNDDNGNPSEPYNLQWGLDRRRAAPAAPAQQGGNSPEVERALAQARHQAQLEKERQAQVQAEEIQKRIQAGILRERAERAKARQAQAAKKQQQQNQQPQAQTQQPQTQTQQPQTQTQQPQTQQPQTQTPANQPAQQPQAQTQQPQTQAQPPANQPTQQPQSQPPAGQDFGTNPMNSAPGASPKAPYGLPAPTPEQKYFFGLPGTSPMNGGPGVEPLPDESQDGDSNLLGWLWNKVTGPVNRLFGDTEKAPTPPVESDPNSAPGASPKAPYGLPAPTPEQKYFFGLPGTSPMNGGPGVDPNAPYGPLPGDTNVPDVEADPNMPVVVDTGPNMDPGIMAPGSEPSNPTPGIQTLPNMIPETPTFADPRADLFGPVGTSPMNGGPGVDPNAPYESYPEATPEQRDFFGPVGTSPMNGYQETFDDAATRAYLKVVNGLDNAYNWGVREMRPRFQQWRKETLEPALERGRENLERLPEGFRRSMEKQAEENRREAEEGPLWGFLRGLGLR